MVVNTTNPFCLTLASPGLPTKSGQALQWRGEKHLINSSLLSPLKAAKFSGNYTKL